MHSADWIGLQPHISAVMQRPLEGCVLDKQECLEWRGLQYERLDGSTDTSERAAAVNRFSAPGALASLLLLTACAK